MKQTGPSPLIFRATAKTERSATRGEVIQTILEAFSIPTDVARTSTEFSDLPADHPFAGAITVAYLYGIIDGDTDAEGNPLGTVRPDDLINRAEVSKIIAILRKLQQ